MKPITEPFMTKQMGLLNFLKKTERPIDFSNDNIERLTKFADELGDTLIKTGFGLYVDILSQIKLEALRHNEEEFKKLVISRELFGGAGALWEIWIEEEHLRIKFEKQFCDFVDLLKLMGIRNGRVNQVRKNFPFTKTN